MKEPEKLTETSVALKLTVGENFAKLPDEAQQRLFMEALKTVVEQTLPETVRRIKKGKKFPVEVGTVVGIVDFNTVEGQNIVDDLGIDRKDLL